MERAAMKERAFPALRSAGRRQCGGRRVFLFLSLVLGALLPPAADALDVSATVDRSKVDLDGRIRLTVDVEGAGRRGADVDLGATDGFRVYSSGTSQNISIVNGAFKSTVSYRYILTPRKTGVFQLGPITVQAGGERSTAGAIRIEVVESAADAGPGVPSGTGGRSRRRGALPPEVMVKARVDREKAYVGEAITYTFQVFTRVRFWSDPEYTPATMEGFWKEDLPPQKTYNTDVKGVTYRVTEIRTALFPTRPGRLVIGPARLTYEGSPVSSGDPFDLFSRSGRGFFGGGRKKELVTDSIAVEVLALPTAGRPVGFTGTVGSFDFSASIDKDSVRTNEPITLTVKISGEGNIRTASLPDIDLSESFKVYDSGASTDVSKENYRVRGKKTYTRVIVPRYGGSYTLPPVSFSYFDPRKEKYVTLRSRAFPITVEGPVHAPDRKKAEIAREESDLRYLKTTGGIHWHARVDPFPFAAAAAANVAPLILLGVLYGLRRKREELSGNVALARKRRADRAARKALSKAARLAGEKDGRDFAATLARAVERFLGDKGDLPVGALTRRQLMSELG